MNEVSEDLRKRVKLGQRAGLSDMQILFIEIELLALRIDAIEEVLKEGKK